MRIMRIQLTPIAVMRHTGFRSQHAVVRIHTDEGLIGIGEMSDFGHLPMYMPDLPDLERTLTEMLAGENPLRVNEINSRMAAAFPEASFVYDMSQVIRSGIDTALYDLNGKALGLPVSDLLGGAVRERIKVCYPIFRHRHPDEIEQNLAFVAERLAAGFNVIRLYAGVSPDLDELFLVRLRECFGDRVTLKSLDFSNLLDWKSALQIIERLAPFKPILVESPAPKNDCDGLREVRLRCKFPVSEHIWSMPQMAELIRNRSVDIFNIAPVFIGGITQARKCYGAAEAAGIPCLVGTTQELSIGTAAQVHLGASMGNMTHISDPTGPWLYRDDVTRQRCRYADGYLYLPEGPGLGMELDEESLARLEAPLQWGETHAGHVLDRTVAVKGGGSA